ncbi:674_t:CDS:2 [Rhizophagus irregularis]|nr:674_t:CDS:2 [Rhizophagus irregularis]
MRFFIVLIALAILAFSTFVASTPTNQERGEGSSRVPSVSDNQNQKRGEGSRDPIDRVQSAVSSNKKRSLLERQNNKCPNGYHWCYDKYGGCCPNYSVCSYPNTCTSKC